MKIERKGEQYGSFTVEISEKFEAQMRKAAERMALAAKRDPAVAEKVIENYCAMIESSISLMLSIIGLALLRPEIMQHVANTLKDDLEFLLDRLKRENVMKEAMS